MSDKIVSKQESPQLVATQEITCTNCHAPVDDRFCGRCGQSVEPTLKYFGAVFLHLLNDIFSFDSRVRRTIGPLLTRPGFLTNEYFAGRRVQYVPPLRLYLFISIIFFISLEFFAGSENSDFLTVKVNNSLQGVEQHITELQKNRAVSKSAEYAAIDQELEKYITYKNDLSNLESKVIQGLTKELVTLELLKIEQAIPLNEQEQHKVEHLSQLLKKAKNGEPVTFFDKGFSIANDQEGGLSFDFLSKEDNVKLTELVKSFEKKAKKVSASDVTPLIKEVISKLPQLMFILLPIFAVILKILFLFSKRLYLEHLTVALHSHSFIFLILLITELLSYLENIAGEIFPALNAISETGRIVLLCWIPIYLFVMQKRIYRQGYFITTVKYFFISISYSILIVITALVAFVWGIMQS